MNIEKFKDFYTEGSFAVRDTEVTFKIQIGHNLSGASEEDLKSYAKAIHRHVSFLKECIFVAEHWLELEKTYTKNKSWSDLVKESGFKKEKRPRKSLKKIIEERKEAHEITLKIALETGGEEINRNYAQGKYDEDMEILREIQE